MAEQHLDTDSLMDLAHGLHEDAERLLAHLRSCAICEREFQRISGGLEHDLSILHRIVRRRPRALRTRVLRVTLRYAIAAMLLFFLLPRPLAWRELLPSLSLDAERITTRAGDDAERFAEAIESYQSRDYDHAIEALRLELADPQLDVFRRLLLANALAQRGRYAGSVEQLQGLPLGALPSPWREEGLWTLYVGQRATAQDSAALRTLDILLEVSPQERARIELERRALLERMR